MQDLLGPKCHSAPIATEDVWPPLLKQIQHFQLATLLAQPPHPLQLVPFQFHIGDGPQQAVPAQAGGGDLGEVHPGYVGQGVAHNHPWVKSFYCLPPHNIGTTFLLQHTAVGWSNWNPIPWYRSPPNSPWLHSDKLHFLLCITWGILFLLLLSVQTFCSTVRYLGLYMLLPSSYQWKNLRNCLTNDSAGNQALSTTWAGFNSSWPHCLNLELWENEWMLLIWSATEFSFSFRSWRSPTDVEKQYQSWFWMLVSQAPKSKNKYYFPNASLPLFQPWQDLSFAALNSSFMTD